MATALDPRRDSLESERSFPRVVEVDATQFESLADLPPMFRAHPPLPPGEITRSLHHRAEHLPMPRHDIPVARTRIGVGEEMRPYEVSDDEEECRSIAASYISTARYTPPYAHHHPKSAESDPSVKAFVESFNEGTFASGEKHAEALDRLRTIVEPLKGRSGRIISSLLSGARMSLYMMSKCDDYEVKKTALMMLTNLLKNTPIDDAASFGLPALLIEVLKDLDVITFSTVGDPELQAQIAEVLALTIETILISSGAEKQNAIPQEVKYALIKGLEPLADFNTSGNPNLEFWLKYAQEAAQRLTTEEPLYLQWLAGVYDMAQGIYHLANGTIAVFTSPTESLEMFITAYEKFQEGISTLPWKNEWFDKLFLTKRQVLLGLHDSQRFLKISSRVQGFKLRESVGSDDDSTDLLFGVVNLMEFVALNSRSQANREAALKLILQYSSISNPKIQERSIKALLNIFKRSEDPSIINTCYILLELLYSNMAVRGKLVLGKEITAALKTFAQTHWERIDDTPPLCRISSEEICSNVIKYYITRLLDVKRDDRRDYAGESLMTLIALADNKPLTQHVIKIILQLSNESCEKNAWGKTAYHIAAENNNGAMIQALHTSTKMLSKYGIVDETETIDYQEHEKRGTALHLAAQRGHSEAVIALLTAGANPNLRDINGKSAFHAAVNSGDQDTIKAFLSCRTRPLEIDSIDYAVRTPLNTAIENQDATTAFKIYQIGGHVLEDPTKYSSHEYETRRLSPLIIAARDNNITEVCSFIKRALAEEIDEGTTRLAHNESLAIMRMISRDGRSLSCSQEFAELHHTMLETNEHYRECFARFNQWPRLVKTESGSFEMHPLSSICTPIVIAARQDADAALRLFITEALTERTPEGIKHLTHNETLAIMRMISRDGCSLNCSGEFAKFHHTMLETNENYRICFTEFEHWPQLIRTEADAFEIRHLPEDDPEILLITYAQKPDKLALLQELLRTHRFDLNKENFLGLNALHLAVLAQNYGAISELQRAGADINDTASRRYTPLHLAAFTRDTRMIQILMEAGSDPTKPTDYGDTPAHVYCCGAKKGRLPAACKLLLGDRLDTFPLKPLVKDLELLTGLPPYTPLANLLEIEEPETRTRALEEYERQESEPMQRILTMCDVFGNNLLHHSCWACCPEIASYLCRRFKPLFWQRNIMGRHPLAAAMLEKKPSTRALRPIEAPPPRDERIAERAGAFDEEKAVELERPASKPPSMRKQGRATIQAMITSLVETREGVAHYEVLAQEFAEQTAGKVTLANVLAFAKMHDEFQILLTRHEGLALAPNASPDKRTLRRSSPAKTMRRSGAANATQLFLIPSHKRTALHTAAVLGDTKLLRLYIASHANIYPIDSHRNTPAHLAALHGETVFFQELVESTPITRQYNTDRRLPIHLAALKGHLGVVTIAYEKSPSSLRKRDGQGNTPALLACKYGQADVLRFFLEKDISCIYDTNDDGRNMLHVACSCGHNHIVKMILKYVETKKDDSELYRFLETTDANDHTAAIIAAQEGQVDCLRILRRRMANIRAQGFNLENALHKAVSNLHLPTIAFLLEWDSTLPISDRCIIKQLDITQEAAIRELKSSFHLTDLTVPVQVLTLLLTHGSDVTHLSDEGTSFLHDICRHSALPLVHTTWKHFCPTARPSRFQRKILSSCDIDKNTLLHIACETGDEAMFDFVFNNMPWLVAKKNKDGMTPLLVACQKGHLHLVKKMFVRYPKLLNATDNKKRTPLHILCGLKPTEELSSFLTTYQFLFYHLRKKQDHREKTPLHTLASCREFTTKRALEEILDVLIGPSKKRSKYITKKDKDDRTAIMIAGANPLLSSLISGYLQKRREMSPLLMIVERGYFLPAEVLIRKKASITDTTPTGQNILHIICRSPLTPESVLFLKLHQDILYVLINTVDDKGMTPLHYLSSNNTKTSDLLQKAVDFILTNFPGTPAECRVYIDQEGDDDFTISHFMRGLIDEFSADKLSSKHIQRLARRWFTPRWVKDILTPPAETPAIASSAEEKEADEEEEKRP
jgi:ankyrin repeat protein